MGTEKSQPEGPPFQWEKGLAEFLNEQGTSGLGFFLDISKVRPHRVGGRFLFFNTCKAKRGQRPRVRSTPIDNTYVQVNNECSLLCYRSSKSCPTWRLPVSIADPASMPIFAFPNIEPEHSVLHKTFLKASRVVVIHSFLI